MINLYWYILSHTDRWSVCLKNACYIILPWLHSQTWRLFFGFHLYHLLWTHMYVTQATQQQTLKMIFYNFVNIWKQYPVSTFIQQKNGEGSHLPHEWMHVTRDAGTVKDLLSQLGWLLRFISLVDTFFFTTPLCFVEAWEFKGLFLSKEHFPHVTLSVTVHAALLHFYSTSTHFTRSVYTPCSPMADRHS